MFASTNLHGKMNVPTMNAFQKMGSKLKKSVDTKDVSTFRLTTCKVLYNASLKLVQFKVEKLLTDAY